MPVKKFRSVEEMNQLQWRAPGSPELMAAIRAVWDFGRRTRAEGFPPGVYKQTGIEGAQALREKWLAARTERSHPRGD